MSLRIPAWLRSAIPTLLLIATVAPQPAAAQTTFTDWTYISSTTVTGALQGRTITGAIRSGGYFDAIYTNRFTDSTGSGVESIDLRFVEAGSDHIFDFSSPFNILRFYVDNFDSNSEAVITAAGATSISLVSASPSMSFTPSTGSTGVLDTTNTSFNGEGQAVLEITGNIQSVRMQYTSGHGDNGISYTFSAQDAGAAVPEPSAMFLFVPALALVAVLRQKRSPRVS